MSNYIYNLGVSIERALAGIPRAQPAQVAGYWANRDFWLAEFDHFRDVLHGFDDRLARMRDAYDRYAQNNGGEHNADEFGTPRQRIVELSSSSQRKKDASGARSALKTLADRALDLKIATSEEYDTYVRHLRVTPP